MERTMGKVIKIVIQTKRIKWVIGSKNYFLNNFLKKYKHQNKLNGKLTGY